MCNYVLQHGAEHNKQLFSEQTIETVMNIFYVDDCLKSVPHVEDANVIIYELTELLSLSGFTLHKWLCNVPEVMNNILEQHRAPSAVNFPISGTDCKLSERILGIMWNVVTDTFIFPSVVNDKPYTKRGILSMTSSFYDPIGFFSPVILTAKVVLQDITRQNCSWDDPASSDINNNNNNCLKSNIQCIEIRVQWTVHLGSSHMHVHAVTRVHAVTPKLVICVMYLTSI